MSIKTSYCSTETNAIFNSAGCDPFSATTSSNSHYFPSSFHETSFELKHTVLTPEKIEKIPVKDNDSYIPLSYSYCEEESDTSKESIPETFNLILKHSEPEVCAPKERINSVEESKTKLNLKKVASFGSRDSSLVDCADKIFLSEGEIEEPDEIRPKMSSTQRSSSSNISQLVNRFRYGKPLPPSERKRQSTVSNKSETTHSILSSRPPSGGGKMHYDWLNSDVMSSSSKLPPDEIPASLEDLQSHDTSIGDLQLRVEKILKDSTSELHSQPQSGSSAWSSISQSSFRNDVSQPTTKPSSSDISVALESSRSKTSSSLPVSSFTTQHMSTMIEKDATTFSATEVENVERSSSKYDSTTWGSRSFHSLSSAPGPKTQQPVIIQPPGPKDYLRDVPSNPPHLHPSSSSIPYQDDILQQWRLRRKIEEARTAATDPVAKHHFKQGFPPLRDFPEDTLRFAPAEKPLDLPLKDKRSIGISVVPMATAQTQTSPTSSLSYLDTASSSKMLSEHIERDDRITMHRVTVVPRDANEHRPTPPASVASQLSSTDVWSEVKTPESTSRPKKKLKRPKKSTPTSSVSSPTTTMVKKVVGTRLFDVSIDTVPTSESTLKPQPNNTFNSTSSEQTSSEGSTYLETKHEPNVPTSTHSSDEDGKSSKLSDTVEDPDEMFRDLLQRIEQDVDDFKDDPVLISLRQQRRMYMAELLSIDEKLKQLQVK